MKTFYIFVLILLQRSLSMESNTSSTENSTNDNEFLEQLEKAKKDSMNDDDSEEGFLEVYDEYADYMNDNNIDTNEMNDETGALFEMESNESAGFLSNESQYKIQQAQKQQERDEAEKEANFKLAARKRFPNVAHEWFEKAFFWYEDLFMRENFLNALEKYMKLSLEDVDYAFKTFGDKRACEYLNEVTADKILAAKLGNEYRLNVSNEYRLNVIEKAKLLNEFGLQYNLKPSDHAKYFSLRKFWVKKGSECEREFKRFRLEGQSKHMKDLIGCFLDMEDRLNLALTSKTMREDSGLLGKHMVVRMNSELSTAELDAEFCLKDFKMVKLCIDGGQFDDVHDAYMIRSLVLILPDKNGAWHRYTFEGEIMIPEKGIKIEIFNKETFNVDMSELEKLIKSASKKLVWKLEKMDEKTNQKATVRIIFRKCFYFTRRDAVRNNAMGDRLIDMLTTRQLLKLHFQK